MKPYNYLKDQSFVFIVFALFGGLGFIFLRLINATMEILVVFSLTYATSIGCILLHDYHRKVKFYRTLDFYLEELDQVYLVHELMKQPDFLEGQIFCDALERINYSMLDQVNYYKRLQKEYKEYIELWIHEVKTPLATCKLILENRPTSASKILEDELNQMDDYVQQALFYARSQYVEKDYSIREICLDVVLGDVLKRYARTFITKKIRLDLQFQDKYVYSDPKWLYFILQQIIQNALKYTTVGEGQVSIQCSEDDYQSILTIQDNGVGIDEKDIARVFEKGFTDSKHTNQQATGLGLYLCKKLCDKLDIGISVASKQGVCVTLRFPHYKTNNIVRRL